MTGGVVVVLGRTGRDFRGPACRAASPACCDDEDKGFEKRCNMSMIELEPVEENASWQHYHAAGDLDHHGRRRRDERHDRYDAERLHRPLIANHARYTNSERAEEILASRTTTLRSSASKVMPVEYRRALEGGRNPDPAARRRGREPRHARRARSAVSRTGGRNRAAGERVPRRAARESASRCRAGASSVSSEHVAWTYTATGAEVVQINVAEDFGAGLPPVIYVAAASASGIAESADRK